MSFRLRSLTSSPRVSVVDVAEEKGPEDRGVFFWKGLWGLGLYATPSPLHTLCGMRHLAVGCDGHMQFAALWRGSECNQRRTPRFKKRNVCHESMLNRKSVKRELQMAK